MSDTPETDAEEVIISPLEGDWWVLADFARKLERERNKYGRAVELIAEDCESWSGVETDVGGYSFVKAVAKYAREVLQ
jgi:hypothetical protein